METEPLTALEQQFKDEIARQNKDWEKTELEFQKYLSRFEDGKLDQFISGWGRYYFGKQKPNFWRKEVITDYVQFLVAFKADIDFYLDYLKWTLPWDSLDHFDKIQWTQNELWIQDTYADFLKSPENPPETSNPEQEEIVGKVWALSRVYALFRWKSN